MRQLRQENTASFPFDENVIFVSETVPKHSEAVNINDLVRIES